MSTMSKKGSRTIIVNGSKYRYIIKAYDGKMGGYAELRLIVQNEITKITKKGFFEYTYNVTPKVVRTFILNFFDA